MPNRRGRTPAKAERPSSCSPVSTSRRGGGVSGRGFPAVAIFDLLFTEVITPEWWNPGFTVRYSSRTNRGRTLQLPDIELRSQGHHEEIGGEWIEIGAWEWVR